MPDNRLPDVSLLGIYSRYLKGISKIKSVYFMAAPKVRRPDRLTGVGLSGCGNFARYAYIPAFNRKKAPMAVSGLYSNSPTSSERVKRLFRYKVSIFSSFEQLLNSGIKAVILTLPNYLHYDCITKALRRGIDVFCEKPLTLGLDEASDLKKYLEGSNNILMTGFNQRYSDRVRVLKSLLENGMLGQIRGVRAFHNQDIGGYLSKSDWLSDSRKSGGGVLYNAGIHLVNLMLYLFGPVASVSARLENKKLPEIYGEDTAVCDLVYKSGIQAQLSASYVNGVSSSYEHMIITGSKGDIYTDMKTSSIFFRPGTSSRWRSTYCKRELVPDTVSNELLHFHDCITRRLQPDTDISDFIDTLKVIKLARESSLGKRRVFVE
jgi:predicted dehydrogenase